jgi:hypothetical protein
MSFPHPNVTVNPMARLRISSACRFDAAPILGAPAVVVDWDWWCCAHHNCDDSTRRALSQELFVCITQATAFPASGGRKLCPKAVSRMHSKGCSAGVTCAFRLRSEDGVDGVVSKQYSARIVR